MCGKAQRTGNSCANRSAKQNNIFWVNSKMLSEKFVDDFLRFFAAISWRASAGNSIARIFVTNHISLKILARKDGDDDLEGPSVGFHVSGHFSNIAAVSVAVKHPDGRSKGLRKEESRTVYWGEREMIQGTASCPTSVMLSNFPSLGSQQSVFVGKESWAYVEGEAGKTAD